MRLRNWLVLSTLFAAACGAAITAEDVAKDAKTADVPTVIVETLEPTSELTVASTQKATPDPTQTFAPTPIPIRTAEATEQETGFLPEEPPPSGAQREFSTDFGRHTVPYSEILSGGPPKDGIPAIDNPKFVTVGEADVWLEPQEPVVLFEQNGDVRAYPLQILMWHEIVNDVVGDIPVSVTFCPLCNTGIAFERTFDGRVLDFGTSGRLRFSNLIMYDRQTETWWQQASGDGIAGEYAGRQLTFLPAYMVGWAEFKQAHPQGKVLSKETGYSRDYGRNPYIGYDDVNRSPFLYDGPRTPGQLPAMARVLTVELNGEAVAYPNDILSKVHVVNDTIADRDVVVIWEPGTASALEGAAVASGSDVGAAAAFDRELDGQTLTFRFEEDRIVDQQTGSEWNVLGQAVDGPLAGSELVPVVSVNHFWFSWAAFMPETRIYEGS